MDSFIGINLFPYSFGSGSNNPNNLSMYFQTNFGYKTTDGSFVFYPNSSLYNVSNIRRLSFNYLSTDYVVLGESNCSSVGQSIDNSGSFQKIKPVSDSWLQSFSQFFNLNLDLSSAGSTNYVYVPVVDHDGVKVLDWSNTHFASSYNESGYYGTCKLGMISQLYSTGGSSGGDTPASDYSQISNAIYYLGATIIVVCFLSIIYKMFIRLRG